MARVKKHVPAPRPRVVEPDAIFDRDGVQVWPVDQRVQYERSPLDDLISRVFTIHIDEGFPYWRPDA